jgi:hypothetical protein
MANSLVLAAQGVTISSTGGSGGCPFCDKVGLLFLPLIYGAAPADAGAPALPSHCGGKNVCGVGLTKSAYALRMVRDGYLYVLVVRTVGARDYLSWQAYSVSAEGYLAEFPFLYPPLKPPEFTCDPETHGRNASMVAIKRAEDVSAAYLLFSPSPLTALQLGSLSTITAANQLCEKGVMTRFNPAAWVKGTHEQAHCLSPADLPRAVVEFALYALDAKLFYSPLTKAMFNTAFPPMVRLPDENRPSLEMGAKHLSRLGSLRSYMVEQNALAVAVPDPIGIVQSLNDFRNDPLNAVENLNLMVDATSGITNRERFNVLQSLKEVQANFEQGTLRGRTEFKNELRDEIRAKYEPIFADDSPALARRKRRWLAKTNPRAREQVHPSRQSWPHESESNRQKAAQVQKELAAIDQRYPESWTQDAARKEWLAKYAPLLDADAMDAFEKRYLDAADKAMALANERADDHLKWLRDERLLAAFDALYDKANNASGWHFQYQASMCMAGMSGVKKCEELIDKWLQAPSIERDNLYMRSYVMNQESLRLAANEAFKEATALAANVKHPAEFNGVALHKAFQKFASTLKSSDSAWDEYARNPAQGRSAGMHKTFEGRRLYQLSEFTRSICRAGIGSLEMGIVARLGSLLHLATGAIAEKIRMHELMFRVDTENPFHPGDKGAKRGTVATTSLQEAKDRHATGMTESDARAIAAKEAAAGKSGSMELMHAAREKHEQRVAGLRLTIDEAVKQANEPGGTNNYHQVRMGVTLAGLEVVALFFYVKDLREKGYTGIGQEETLRVLASGMSLSAMMLDTVYAHAKSVREIAPNAALKGSGDIVRGGFKVAAGFMAAGAGGIGVWLDATKLIAASKGDSRPEVVLSWLKLGSSFLSASFGFVAAVSYAAPTLQRIALVTETNVKVLSPLLRAIQMTLGGTSEAALWLSKRVALLTWVARFNWAGFAVMLGEGTYWVYLRLQPSAFEVWCTRSQFAKKATKAAPFGSGDEELKALAAAVKLEGL